MADCLILDISNDPTPASALFSGWEETLITSCLTKTMGRVFMTADGSAAMARLGDFAFLAGRPNEDLAAYDPAGGFCILVPGSEGWERVIEAVHAGHCTKAERYAFRKDTVFDAAHLETLCAVPEGYTMKLLDEAAYRFAKQNDWCRDWVSQFADWQDYAVRGIGVVIETDGQPVSGAASYSVYPGGIEIEIQTLEPHRRKGLAAACAARLILECLKRGLYPSWDAANLWSAGLAEKLGYQVAHPYTAYFIEG